MMREAEVFNLENSEKLSIRSRSWLSIFFPCLALLTALNLSVDVSAQPFDFTAPEKLTDGSANFRLSRTPSRQMAYDSEGTLHVVYWAGGFATTVSTPSFIYYRSRKAFDGWSGVEVIDNSFDGSNNRLGGRQPSLTVAPDDTVWIAWHDHRHTQAATPFNNIDNLEVYADFKPTAGSFSSTDIRITQTSAAHLGDNAFAPHIAAATDGSLSIAWYDFHADNSVSDIYLKTSDASGNFPGGSILDFRLTDKDDRGPTPAAFTVPDLAIAPDATRHVVWTSGTGGAAPLYYAEAPNPFGIVTPQTLASDTGGFFDPPRIAAAPGGDLWIAYTDRSQPTSRVALFKRPSGSSSFAPVFISAAPNGAQTAPDIEIDAAGTAHLVWVEQAAEAHVYYGQVGEATGSIVNVAQLTEFSAEWARPSLALDAGGRPVVLFEENIAQDTAGDIWFVRGRSRTAAAEWSRYE